MPRYDFQCSACGLIREHTFRMADKPDTVDCACGGVCSSLISDSIEVMFKDTPFNIHLNNTCFPIGWNKGNTDPDVQEARYREMIHEDRKQARKVDKQAIKNGIRKIATVPREFHRLRQNQFGKDYWNQDTKQKLKRDGLLHVD